VGEKDDPYMVEQSINGKKSDNKKNYEKEKSPSFGKISFGNFPHSHAPLEKSNHFSIIAGNKVMNNVT
jgi:hypothetical protein